MIRPDVLEPAMKFTEQDRELLEEIANDGFYLKMTRKALRRALDRLTELEQIIPERGEGGHPEHMRRYAPYIPSAKRVAESHTSMTRGSLVEITNGRGHRVYTQGSDEGCFICALLYDIDALEQQREAALKLADTYDEATDAIWRVLLRAIFKPESGRE